MKNLSVDDIIKLENFARESGHDFLSTDDNFYISLLTFTGFSIIFVMFLIILLILIVLFLYMFSKVTPIKFKGIEKIIDNIF